MEETLTLVKCHSIGECQWISNTCFNETFSLFFQQVDLENSYLCGYLTIKGLTEEYPELTTFFDGEIISKKYPFLTRKWDADEDVDRRHWVSDLWNRIFQPQNKQRKTMLFRHMAWLLSLSWSTTRALSSVVKRQHCLVPFWRQTDIKLSVSHESRH